LTFVKTFNAMLFNQSSRSHHLRQVRLFVSQESCVMEVQNDETSMAFGWCHLKMLLGGQIRMAGQLGERAADIAKVSRNPQPAEILPLPKVLP
jgi:hypothetical protein